MPYLGADAVVQAGRVAATPGHLGFILVVIPIPDTAHSVAAARMDALTARAAGLLADSVQQAMDREPGASCSRGWQLPVLQ